MRITLEQYLKGYETIYPDELTAEVRANAETTVERVNALIDALAAAGIEVEVNPRTGSALNSGWRPAAINANVKGAAPRSKHMTGQAADLYDPEGALDDWCLAHPAALATLELWQEHPGSTKGWLHVQCVPPRSGNRVFYP